MNIEFVHIALEYNGRRLFEDFNLKVRDKEKILLTAPSGSGKTTLLRIIAGEEQADTGTIHKPADLRLGYLPQGRTFDLHSSLRAVVRRASGDLDVLEAELADLANQLAAAPEEVALIERYDGLLQRIQRANPSRTEQILAESNRQIASAALAQSAERPDPWQVADSALDIGIGVCALFGGVLGTRALRFLQEARAKSQALKEIIQGNESFKEQNARQVEAFKAAQQHQSPETRRLVTAMKG